MKESFKKLIIGTLALFMAASVQSYAQQNLGRGRISGEVVDETGAPLVGVTVSAVHKNITTTTLEGKTNKKGHFAIAGLGTGVWRFTGTKEGYVESYFEMQVSQLSPNPPFKLTLQKISAATAAAVGGSKANETAVALAEKGNELLKQGDLDGALAAFQEFSAMHPEIYKVRLNIGSLYSKKGEYDKAETEFKFVLDKIKEKGPDYSSDKVSAAGALSGIGEIALRKEDLKGATQYFTEALALSPNDEAVSFNVAEIFFAHQKTDDAIKYYELAANIKPTWSKPYSRLGYAYLNKGDYTKALENFKKFLELDPNSAEAGNVKNVMTAIEQMKK